MIDFKELDQKNSGQRLQQLAYALGKSMNLKPYYSGPGPDDGIDLIYYDLISSPVAEWTVKWLVQCKDFSSSGTSVAEKDVGCIYDKVLRHDCHGYLLIATTDMTAGLSKLLNKLGQQSQGPILTACWNGPVLEKLLINSASVLHQFMPNAHAELKKQGLVA